MSKICINCGAELKETAVFCDECGTRQMKENPSRQQMYGQVNQTPNQIKNSGIGIASFVLGIVAMCTLPSLPLIPGILGIILSIIALMEKNTKKGMAIVGMVMSVISILLLIIIYGL